MAPPATPESYADAHANSANMPCPHCHLAIPRGARFCSHCGWHLVTGTPHPLTDEEMKSVYSEAAAAGEGTSSSSGRKPTTAQYRAQVIAGFSKTPGVALPSGPTLADQLEAGDKILATLEADEDRAERALRETLAARFPAAAGEDLPAAVRQAQAIAAARAPSPAALDDVQTLGAAYREWSAVSAALTAARDKQAKLLERWHENRLGS